ncbi:hypothetical protein HU200_010815 [Digitaria exilis]|uniref:F-box domain-containing protein n=1 Tax=Digitaria exilis TaxID=1010633 RepID=A0A835KN72_9POAL|nr:hypothetical protein HU200_010815 [Digitaria exilis]
MACGRDTPPPRSTSILDVPDDLLELVLLRVHTPICLFRAAATCKPWRRVVSGAGFLDRLRAIHGPHFFLLGHYCVNTVDMEDGHVLTDSHGSLLAFVHDNAYAVVSDPWNRQYQALHFPWVHPGFDAERYFDNCHYYSLGAFLLDDVTNMSGFRACTIKQFLGRVGGSILWSGWDGNLLVLDESSGEFSIFRLPPAMAPGVDVMNNGVVYPLYETRVVGGGATGGVRMVSVVGGGEQLEVLTWTHGVSECTVERRVGLCQLANIGASLGLSWLFLDNATASTDLVLGAILSDTSTMKVFSLDVETMKLHRMKKSMALRAQKVFPYELPWPQTISACCDVTIFSNVVKGAR